MNDEEEIFARPPAGEEIVADSGAKRKAGAFWRKGLTGWRRFRRDRRFRWLRRAALAGVLLWFFWYPMDSRELFLAMPEETVAAVCFDGLASEDGALVKHPVFRDAVSALGLDPDRVAKNNDGTYWTLFWLSGRHSVAGLVPAEGECGGLGYWVAGATYVGWKARGMELLRLVRYVPALGPLKTTAKGTRYMEFPDAPELSDRGIVLGLDIVDGVLLVALANDPDRVLELVRRVRGKGAAPKLARCFRDTPWAPPGLDVPLRHRAWVARHALPGVAAMTVDLPSFREPGLSLDCEARDEAFRRAPFAPLAAGRGSFAGLTAPLDSAILVAACDAAAAASLLGPDAPVARGAPGVAWVADQPYLGDFSPLLLVPSLCASLPRDPTKPFGAWWDRTFARFRREGGGLRLSQSVRSDGARLLRAGAVEVFGTETPEGSRAFLRPTADRIELGSHAGLWDRQLRDGAAKGGDTVGGLVERWRDDPAFVAALRLDADRFGAQFAHFGMGGVLGLALRTGMVRLEPGEAEEAELVCEVAEAARALGVVDVAATRAGPDALRVRIRASGR